MNFKSLPSIAVLGFCFASLVNAMPDKAALTKAMSKLTSNPEVENIQKTPVKGIYQFNVGAHVLYATEDGKYLFYGQMLDVSKEAPNNITENTMKSLRMSAINKVDPKTMIDFSPAKAKHTITIFTDIDCAYCRKLHQEVPELNKAGIAVRYVSFPRTGENSPSFYKAVNVWCAKDRQKALTEAKSGDEVAETPGCEMSSVIKRHLALVNELDLRATPVIVLEDGTEIPGYVPAEQLIERVNNAG